MGEIPTNAVPGNFFCVSLTDEVAKLISIGEWLNGDVKKSKSSGTIYNHAAVYLGIDHKPNGNLAPMILEAEPGGAVIVPFHYQDVKTIWSTDKYEVTNDKQIESTTIAQKLVGTPYSFFDYLALAAHRFEMDIPGLRKYIANSHHMICSQLVDEFYKQLGINLFDGVWEGYVTPQDLANLLS